MTWKDEEIKNNETAYFSHLRQLFFKILIKENFLFYIGV